MVVVSFSIVGFRWFLWSALQLVCIVMIFFFKSRIDWIRLNPFRSRQILSFPYSQYLTSKIDKSNLWSQNLSVVIQRILHLRALWERLKERGERCRVSRRRITDLSKEKSCSQLLPWHMKEYATLDERILNRLSNPGLIKPSWQAHPESEATN